MSVESYKHPVSQLLSYGDCNKMNSDEWPNYVEELGFGEEHISELIRMATDKTFFDIGEETDRLDIWAPVHAWRTLAQLKAEAAIEGLTPLLNFDDDWVMGELPEVYSLIGPAAIPFLIAHLGDSDAEIYSRAVAIDALEKIGNFYPDFRDQCVAILTKQLSKFTEQDRDFNGILVGGLVGLKAVESARVIERAFATDRVEPFIIGDWWDAQVELGLKSKDEVRPESENSYFRSFPSRIDISEESSTSNYNLGKLDQKTKAKRKQAQESRKKNRKKRK